METVLEYMNKAIALVQAVPQEAWAVVAGVLVAALGTQFIKRVLPLELIAQFPCWEHSSLAFLKGKAGDMAYRSAIRLIAFAIGFTSCYILWPEPVYKLVVSTVVALAAPLIYKLAIAAVYKKWPHLQGKLSGYPDSV